MSEQKFKICLVGPAKSGKSTFIRKLFNNTFTSPKPTLGVEVHTSVLDIDGNTIRFYIWDCAGREKYGGLKEGYYMCADAFIVFFDISDQKSIDEANNIKSNINQNVPVILVGNKNDLGELECNRDFSISTKNEDVREIMEYLYSLL